MFFSPSNTLQQFLPFAFAPKNYMQKQLSIIDSLSLVKVKSTAQSSNGTRQQQPAAVLSIKSNSRCFARNSFSWTSVFVRIKFFFHTYENYRSIGCLPIMCDNVHLIETGLPFWHPETHTQWYICAYVVNRK